MGAWDAKPFGNDSAADWAWELDESSDWSLVSETLDLALSGSYIDEDDATLSIAAAEVVAHGLGKPIQSDAYTESVAKFVARVPAPTRELVEKARDALAAATGPQSGLTELWSESGEADWSQANAELLAALS